MIMNKTNLLVWSNPNQFKTGDQPFSYVSSPYKISECSFFKKAGRSRPLLIYFRRYNTVDRKQLIVFNINFANDWIRTTDLWYRTQPLYHLSHNPFPSECSLSLHCTYNVSCSSFPVKNISEQRVQR